MNRSALLGYLAGALDADGFISIQRQTRKVGGKYAHAPTYYMARIGFSETSPIVPRLFVETFGGSFYEYQPKNALHKRWYIWQACNDVAQSAVKDLLPHLRLKRKQGEVLLRFVKLIHSQRKRCMRQRITEEIEASRRGLWEELTHLNSPRNRRVHFATEVAEP